MVCLGMPNGWESVIYTRTVFGGYVLPVFITTTGQFAVVFPIPKTGKVLMGIGVSEDVQQYSDTHQIFSGLRCMDELVLCIGQKPAYQVSQIHFCRNDTPCGTLVTSFNLVKFGVWRNEMEWYCYIPLVLL